MTIPALHNPTSVVTSWLCRSCGQPTTTLHKPVVRFDILRNHYIEHGLCEECFTESQVLADHGEPHPTHFLHYHPKNS